MTQSQEFVLIVSLSQAEQIALRVQILPDGPCVERVSHNPDDTYEGEVTVQIRGGGASDRKGDA